MSAVKFTFDNDFKEDDGSTIEQNRMAEISSAAFEQGQEAGRAEILDSLERSCNDLLENISTAAQNLINRQNEQVALMNKEAASLAIAIVEKLAPALVRKIPLEEIELLVDQCLQASPLEPRFVIRVDDVILPNLQDKIEKISRDRGFPGQIVLISTPMTNVSDCRVEWANGGVERDFDSLMAIVKNTVQLFIDSPETAPFSATGQIDKKNGILSETITD